METAIAERTSMAVQGMGAGNNWHTSERVCRNRNYFSKYYTFTNGCSVCYHKNTLNQERGVIFGKHTVH